MYNDGDSLQYIEQNSNESYFTVRSYPSALNKKVSPGAGAVAGGWLLLVRDLPALLDCFGHGWVPGRNICNLGALAFCRLPLGW